MKADAIAEVFNLFNHDNFGGYVTISGTLVTVEEWNTFRIYIYDISRPTPGVAVATFPYTVWATAISGRTLFLGANSSREVVYVYSPTEPGLTIAAAGSNSATISWTPVDWPDFVLQYSDTLAPDSWVNAPSGASNPVTVSSTNAARFYRLFSP